MVQTKLFMRMLDSNNDLEDLEGDVNTFLAGLPAGSQVSPYTVITTDDKRIKTVFMTIVYTTS